MNHYKVGMLLTWRPRSWLLLIIDYTNNIIDMVLIDNQGEDSIHKLGSIFRTGCTGTSLLSKRQYVRTLEDV